LQTRTYIFILNNALLDEAPTPVSFVQNLRVNFSSIAQESINEIKLFIKASKSKNDQEKISY